MNEIVRLENSPATLIVHDKGNCRGEYCTIHNRSDHVMRSFPQSFRFDRALMERICPHGIGHPDPDELNLERNSRRVHGCDGCCKGAYLEKLVTST